MFQARTAPQPGARLRLVSVHVCYVEADKALRFVEEAVGTAAAGGGGSGMTGGKETVSCSVPISALVKVRTVVAVI